MASPDPPASPSSSPQSERAHKLIGTTVGGRYKVLSLLGEGAMGHVFLVEHNVIRRRLALKVLNDEMMKNPEAVARFEREALAAAHIEHPNVVAATDSGRTPEGALFVVFEYVDGQSLFERITKGPMAPSLALHITRQVVSALVRAHGMGIIHRDLKAENIMLVSRDGDDSMAKVLDFGLAKVADGQLREGTGGGLPRQALTRFGAVFGTPAYMAPEQAAGGEVDGRTDLYAVGVLLYEMLAGVLPFESENPATLLRQHVTAPVPSLKARVPGLKVPPAVELLVLKLLEKKRENRFDSAKVLLDSIDALVRTEKLQYDPSAPPTSANPASENETLQAPSDLPARLLEQLPAAERTESLVLTIKKMESRSQVEPAPSEVPISSGPPAQLDGSGGVSAPAAPVPTAVPAEVIQSESAAKASPASGPPSPALSTLRTKLIEHYAKLLDSVRARLPEKHRGVSQRTLGFGMGAVLALPLVILILIIASFGDDSGSGSATMPGFASDRAMEKAVSGGIRDLDKLAIKYPQDSRVFRALAKAHLARKDYVRGMRAFSSLLRLDPTMASDDEMIQIATGAALVPETSDAAILVLESQLGDKGVGILSDLAERTTGEPWKSKLDASLQKGTTRALATEPTMVLLDLRAAQRCEDKRTLLRRAGQQGDARTLAYLQSLQQMTTGCGAGGQSDCWPCLRKGSALKAAIDAINKRLGG